MYSYNSSWRLLRNAAAPLTNIDESFKTGRAGFAAGFIYR